MAIKIPDNFNNIEEVATYLRELNKKKILIFAHNGTGKTRLSMIFKEFGKIEMKASEIPCIIMHLLKIYSFGTMI